MTRLLLTSVLCLGTASSALAQGAVATVNDLSAPTSPAFVLLGIAPAAVERPDNPKLFVVNTLNRISGSESGFPKDYAVQVAPYWMVSHSDLSFETYQHPNVGQSLLQTLAISVATSPIAGATRDADPLGTHLGLGVTTRLFNGRPNPTLPGHIAELSAINAEILDALALNPNADIGALRARAQAKALAIQGLDAQRIGFFLTLSAGQSWHVLDDDAENAASKRRGVWITPAYRRCASKGEGAACETTIDVIGVWRVLKDRGADATHDLGARFVLRPRKAFNLSIESVKRNVGAVSAAATVDSTRTTGLLEYKIREDLVLYGTFGQDFKQATGRRPLVSLLGLNFGFGPNAGVSATPAKK